MKRVYINPQWQGGADLSTYDGAEEIKKYLDGQDYVILPVSTDEAEMSVRKNGIRGFDVLRVQIHSAYDRIQEDVPDKIFTLGGGCDADVPSIVYLIEKYQGNLTVVWLDAHGDLNLVNLPAVLLATMPVMFAYASDANIEDDHTISTPPNRYQPYSKPHLLKNIDMESE